MATAMHIRASAFTGLDAIMNADTCGRRTKKPAFWKQVVGQYQYTAFWKLVPNDLPHQNVCRGPAWAESRKHFGLVSYRKQSSKNLASPLRQVCELFDVHWNKNLQH